MTDDPDTTNGSDRTASDGEVEIEVTPGRSDRSEEKRTDQSQTASRDPSHAADTGGARDRTHDAESNLADELGRVDVMTTPEGYVEGRITDLTAIDATTVRLTVALPHGETLTFTLDKPIPWSQEFFLTRLVEEIGYDAASIDHIIGEPIAVVRADLDEDDEWWNRSVETVGDAVISSLSGGRYRLQSTTDPEWRLVDPLELPAESDAGGVGDLLRSDRVGMALVVLGALGAAIGAVVGATGNVVLSSAVVAPLAVGLIVVWIGLTVVRRGDAEN